MSTSTLRRTNIKTKGIILALAITTAVVLPQLFHALGMISGTGNMLGSTFLPMYIPVILAAFIGGPVVGLICGVVSPFISYAISGMPSVGIMPFMVVELATLGIVGGLLLKANMPIIVKLLITQIAGIAVRALVVFVVVYGFESQTVQMSSAFTTFTVALPGIVLQLVLIPLIMFRIKGLKNSHE